MGRTQKGRKMDNIAQKHYHNSSIVCGVALLMKIQSRKYRVTKSSGRLKSSPRPPWVLSAIEISQEEQREGEIYTRVWKA